VRFREKIASGLSEFRHLVVQNHPAVDCSDCRPKLFLEVVAGKPHPTARIMIS
jgi:hypothetical protein